MGQGGIGYLITVTCDVTVLIFSHGEQGRPFCQVVHVEVNVVILRERIQIGEIHFEQVLWLKGTEGSHGQGGRTGWMLEFWLAE